LATTATLYYSGKKFISCVDRCARNGGDRRAQLSLLRVKASSDDTSTSGDELIEELQAKWDAVENKSTVLTYAGGAIVAVSLASVIVGAVICA
jgi:hypothetical protein